MAKGEVDTPLVAAPKTGELTDAEKQAWRKRFEVAAAKKAEEYLAQFSEQELAPGGVTLFLLGVHFKDVGGIRYPQISDRQLEILLDCASQDYDAYLGAKYIARLWMARRFQLPAPLLSFVLKILSGNETKPRRGRRRAKDTLLRAFMYAWALYINQHDPSIPLVRTENKKNGWDDWSACNMVARAFSDAGKHTTYSQVKSYCYDNSNWHIRAAASMAWQKGRRYEDTAREFDFDLDAFCFGKP